MKHQQVVPDYYTMFKSSCTCLLLAFSGYILLKMIQAIFWLPGYLEKNQKKLEELANKYSVDLNGDKISEKDEEESKELLDDKTAKNKKSRDGKGEKIKTECKEIEKDEALPLEEKKDK